MKLRERGRGAPSAAIRVARRGIRRGGLEAQIRKVEWDIDRQNAAIGQAIYPLLESGELKVGLSDVQERMPRIKALAQRLDELRALRGAQGTDRQAKTEAEARWQGEGGRNVG